MDEPEVPAVHENMYLESELDITEKLAFSDSDNDSPNRSKNGAKPNSTPDAENDDSDIEQSRRGRKNCNKLIDSESENENITDFYDMDHENDQLKISKQKTALIDSDSASAHNSNSESDTEVELHTTKVKRLHKKLPSNNKLDENELTSNLRKLCDDESSSDEDANHSKGRSLDAPNDFKKAPKERPPKKMSAKEAEEQMKVIQSESQRMARETNLSVPYHVPKKHSLKEFLSRRNINKPIPIMNSVKTAAAIKMSKEDLIEYANKLDERAIESQQFYKSDSSDDEAPVPPDSIPTCSEVLDAAVLQEDVHEVTPPAAFQDIEFSTDVGIPTDIETDAYEVTLPTCEEIQVSTDVRIPTDIEKDVHEVTPPSCEDIAVSTDVGIPADIETDISVPLEKPVTNIATDTLSTSVPPPPETEMNCDEFDELVNAKITDARGLVDQIDAQYPGLKKNVYIDYDFGNEEKVTKLHKLQQCIQAQLTSRMSPSIKGCSNSVIDLDSGDILPDKNAGVDDLFQRFLKHSTKPTKKNGQDVCILKTDNGVLELEKITLTIADEDTIIADSKPRSAFFKLKESLSIKLAEKRKEEILKRKMDEEEMEKKNKMYESEEDDDFDLDEIEDEDDKDDGTIIAQENAVETVSDHLVTPEVILTKIDDKAASDKETDEEEHESSDEETQNEASQDETYTSKSRKRIVVLDDSDDEVAPISNAIETDDVPTNELDQSIGALMDSIAAGECRSDSASRTGLEQQLLDSCAGDTSVQSLFTQTNADEVSESQLLDLCSGAFVTQELSKDMNLAAKPQSETNIRLAFESSDDEAEDRGENIKRGRKKIKRLSVEDDSDEECTDLDLDEEEQAGEDEDDDNVEDEEIDENNCFVDYDSEENEIEVLMDRKDRLKKASEFVENEADLSGSEWGSADEDEIDLDRFEKELGDEDLFDQAKIQSELERIHMRRVLDKDASDIKKIQELLFEDEEDNGLGRERQFKWKNVDNNWDEQKNRDEADDAGAAHRDSDEENEEQWRKMRHERELMLKENEGAKDTNLTTAFNASDTPNTDGVVVKKRITIVKSASNTPKLGVSRDSPFLINTKVISTGRNSFLKRDEQTLSKLVLLTKNTADSDGAIPSMVAAAKQRNFVFTALSPIVVDKVQPKRKSSDDYAVQQNQQSKKAKNNHYDNSTSKKRLLDSLT